MSLILSSRESHVKNQSTNNEQPAYAKASAGVPSTNLHFLNNSSIPLPYSNTHGNQCVLFILFVKFNGGCLEDSGAGDA